MLSNETGILANIEKLGERYHEDLLVKRWKKEKLATDWWEGLEFFLSHSFMRGGITVGAISPSIL